MSFMRQSFAIGMGFAGAVWLAAAVTASAQDKPLTIGVSHQSLGFPYAVALQNGELKAAKELGAKTIDLDSHLNTLTQANDIDKLIAQHVDGIVIDPGDSIAAQDWADKAKAAGIPIASMGVFVGDPKKHQPPWVYPALVGLADRNDIEQGYAVGKIAVADNPDGGKVAIVEGLPGFAAVLFRTEGFDKALRNRARRSR
jgi:ABC-type sugar transport system substrate-binding protein